MLGSITSASNLSCTLVIGVISIYTVATICWFRYALSEDSFMEPIFSDQEEAQRDSNLYQHSDEPYRSTAAPGCSLIHEQRLEPLYQVPFSEIYLHHPGKDGGGTLLQRARDVWGLKLEQCHRPPCQRGLADLSTLLLLLRDPIDRFVSGFNWQLFLACDPDDTSPTRRIPSGLLIFRDDPEHHCLPRNETPLVREVTQLVHQKYKTASRLAEALCSEEGRQDLAVVNHIRWMLSQFIPAEWKTMPEKVVPVVLEPGVDFGQQIDNAIFYALNRSYQVYSAEQLATLRRRASIFDRCQRENNPTMELARHSSSGGSITPKTSISEQGMRCLMTYYADTYSLLETLETACKWDECHEAIQSILNRRQHWLNSTVRTPESQ